jgi:subtilisin family serine protease
MRRFLPSIAIGLALSACQDASGPTADGSAPPALLVQGPASQAPEQVMPGRILVQLRDNARLTDLAGSFGLEVERAATRGPSILRGAAGSERAVAARIAGDPRVVYAEPDYLRQPTAIDSRLWAFYNPGGLQIYFTRGRNSGSPVNSLVSVNDADMDNVEGYAAGGADVVVGSIDTGVDFGHPEFLTGQLIAGSDHYSGDGDPSDENGHGTHTTGTIVGRTVGVAGVSGAGPHVKVLVQRVCGPMGCPTSAIVDAIYEAADYPGMVAMNMSLGGSSLAQSEAMAINYAVNTKGVLVIASAGNGSTGTVSCPACDPNAISVAASDWLDQQAYYTNWGPGLDLIAPGGELYSNTTEEAGIYSAYLGGGYAYLQGTSMAAPQVTGTAAIVASKAGLRGAALRARLEGTADDLGASGYDTIYGHGRLNSYRAVTGSTLSEGGGTPPPPPPTLAASFTYSCNRSTTCSFDGTGSTGETSYAWDFGDNASATGPKPTHTFALGTWTVTLVVSDGNGTASTSQSILCKTTGKTTACR